MEGNIFDEATWLDHVEDTKKILAYQEQALDLLNKSLATYPEDFISEQEQETNDTI